MDTKVFRPGRSAAGYQLVDDGCAAPETTYGRHHTVQLSSIGTGEEAELRNSLMGLAQRREQEWFRREIQRLVGEFAEQSEVLDNILALHFVVWTNEDNDLAQLLLEAGCNPFASDFNGDTVLHYAVRGGNLRVLVYLFDRLGDKIFSVLNIHHCNLLLTAAAETNDERTYEILHLLEWLWFRGLSLESQDNQGRTALFWAAQRSSAVVCQWLLSRGANLGHRDHANRSVLHMACFSGNSELVLYLCDKGAINLADSESIDERRINTPSRICWQRGRLWLSLSIARWQLWHRLTGRCSFLSNQYSWNVLWLVLWNLFCGSVIFLRLRELQSAKASLVALTFFPAMASVFISWLSATKNNPGFVKHPDEVAPLQDTLCSRSARDDQLSFAHGGGSGPHCSELRRLEAEALKLSVGIAGIRRTQRRMKRGCTEDGADSSSSRRLSSQHERSVQRLLAIDAAMADLRPFVSRERVAMERSRSTEYADAVASGQGVSRRICFTCHHVRPFRAHHCAECAACIRRFDHHCVWIDNCVGLANQRAFAVFLFFLTLAIFAWFLVVTVYVSESAALGSDSTGKLEFRAFNLLKLLTSFTFYLTLVTSLGNVIWLCFVGYLLQRTVRSMLTDLTYYETLKPDYHVIKRFGPKPRGVFWDLSDITLAAGIQNAVHFCAQSSDRDLVTYPWVDRTAGRNLL